MVLRVFTFLGCSLSASGLTLLLQKSVPPKKAENYSKTLSQLASISSGFLLETAFSTQTSEAFTAVQLISKYTFPDCCHRRGVIELGLLFSTLTNTLKSILASFEGEKHEVVAKFVPPLVNTATNATGMNEIFLGEALFVKRLLTYEWPCGECFSNETVLSHLAHSTGSFQCLRICTHIALTAAVSEDDKSSKVGVEALGLLLPMVAKYGALNGAFLYEINMALLPACLLRGKLTTLSLVPIFRQLYDLSINEEMSQSVKLCLGLSVTNSFNIWTKFEMKSTPSSGKI